MLLNAWVMGLENRQEEAGWILRKYEKTRLFQQRDVRTKELYLYVNSIYRKDSQVTEQAVVQLRKFYQKYPEDWMLTYFLLKLDPELLRDKRTRYRILERQYRMGTRHRLLYLEAWNLLSEDAALFQGLDGFVLQICAWASEHGLVSVGCASVEGMLSEGTLQGDRGSCVCGLHPRASDRQGSFWLVRKRRGAGCQDHQSL